MNLDGPIVVVRNTKFNTGDRVRKIKGSGWIGRVVGFYSTELTPIGYCVESENHYGSVQIYPESALEPAPDTRIGPLSTVSRPITELSL